MSSARITPIDLNEPAVATLRPADRHNLAAERSPCPSCEEGAAVTSCHFCKGRGTVPAETGRRRISHSSLNTQLACLKRWEWHYDKRLELISQPNYLSMGRAFHLGVERRDPFAASDALAERPTSDQTEQDELLKDMAVVWAAVNGYLSRYPSDDDIGGTKVVQREIEYLVRLRSPYTGRPSMTFDLYGFADGVIDHGSYLELIEDKFVGRVDQVMVRKVKLDRQVGLESYALWRITGKPVRIIRYRFTKKPSIKQKQKETVQEYVERVKADYAERPDFYYHEERTFRDTEDMLLLEQELWTWSEQLRQAKQAQVFPRNTSHCSDFGGCPFLPLCLGDPDAHSLYQERPQIELNQEMSR